MTSFGSSKTKYPSLKSNISMENPGFVDTSYYKKGESFLYNYASLRKGAILVETRFQSISDHPILKTWETQRS